jgi:hypothetical protein
MVLNPLQPQLEPFDWALSWHGLISLGQLAGLMETAFFPAWLALLHHWLSHTPDFDEVTRWYLEWKGRFPQVGERAATGWERGAGGVDAGPEGYQAGAAASLAATHP